MSELHSRTGHKLEETFQLSAFEILDIVISNDRVLMNIKGAVAEEHLQRHLRGLNAKGLIENFEAIKKDGQPDFRVQYRQQEFLIECKNVEGKTRADGRMTVDFQRTRNQKDNPCGRFYTLSEFHILAACTYNQSGRWEFLFIDTTNLPRHPGCPDRIYNRVVIDERENTYTSNWSPDIITILEKLTEKLSKSSTTPRKT